MAKPNKSQKAEEKEQEPETVEAAEPETVEAAEPETVEAAEPEVAEPLTVYEKLEEVAEFILSHEDDVHQRDHGIHPVHVGMIREMAARLQKGKTLHLSDGNKEQIGLLFDKLREMGKL